MPKSRGYWRAEREQPPGLGGEAELAGEPALDLIAEGALQHHRGECCAQSRRRRHTADLEAEGALHQRRPQAVGGGQRFEALGRLALEPERLGEETHLVHLLPGARQGTLEPQEDGGAGDAGFARPQVRAGDAHEAGVGERTISR